MGRQGDAKVDRHERDLSPVVQGDSRTSAERSREPAARARVPLAAAGGSDSGSSARSFGIAGRAGRRAFGEAVSAGRPVEGAVRTGVRAGQRRKTVSPQHVYV